MDYEKDDRWMPHQEEVSVMECRLCGTKDPKHFGKGFGKDTTVCTQCLEGEAVSEEHTLRDGTIVWGKRRG